MIAVLGIMGGFALADFCDWLAGEPTWIGHMYRKVRYRL